jgi:hemerythrin-like domain-containing protein
MWDFSWDVGENPQPTLRLLQSRACIFHYGSARSLQCHLVRRNQPALKERRMSHQDEFQTERHRVERVLEILESIAARLEGRRYVPLTLLGDAVEFVRASEDAAYEASQTDEEGPPLSACVEQHVAARVPVREMQQAVRALETGETAAADRFAQFAREYVRLRRDHLRLDDRLFLRLRVVQPAKDATSQPSDETVERPTTRQIYDRLIEASAALTSQDASASLSSSAGQPRGIARGR